MADLKTSETTELLRAWAGGDKSALDRLTPRIYEELRRLAGRLMQGERQGATMQATALVHEAFLKLIDVQAVDWQHKAHFFAVSARIMRRILLDQARRRLAVKRGGPLVRVQLDEVPDVGSARANELIALDDALLALAETDQRKAQVVELRFFAGLSVEESAEALKVSPETIMRDWQFARAWLLAELNAPTGKF